MENSTSIKFSGVPKDDFDFLKKLAGDPKRLDSILEKAGLLGLRVVVREALRRLATARNMKLLRQDGAAKIAAGITSAEEVLRVTQEE